MRHVASLAVAAALLPGCVVHRGFSGPPPAPAGGAAASLLLIGEIAPGRTTSRVAAELERALSAEARAGRRPVVLWLGNHVHPGGPATGDPAGPECGSVDDPWAVPGPRELAAVVRRQVAAGAVSFAVLGHRDWRCGHPELELQAEVASGPHPWAMPDHNYVARIEHDGSTRVVSGCRPAGPCIIETAVAPAPLAELVFVDAAPWVFPPPAGTPADGRASASLAQLRGLLAALRREDAAWPRILVSHLPIETSGPHGLGGRAPSASFRYLPPELQGELARGMFAGCLSAHDRSLQATADVSGAVKRSAKAWLAAPVFQVVSGASSRPDDRHLGAIPRGIALRPDLESTHAGFARVVLAPGRIDLVLHARATAGWRASAISVALPRPPHPVEASAPAMAPCLRCDPRRGAADAAKWE